MLGMEQKQPLSYKPKVIACHMSRPLGIRQPAAHARDDARGVVVVVEHARPLKLRQVITHRRSLSWCPRTGYPPGMLDIRAVLVHVWAQPLHHGLSFEKSAGVMNAPPSAHLLEVGKSAGSHIYRPCCA